MYTSANIYDRMHALWQVFDRHHPVGRYVLAGGKDGDCIACELRWPCAEVRKVLDSVTDLTGILGDLHNYVEINRRYRDIGYREAAAEIGIPVSGLFKLEHNEVDPRLSTVLKVLAWLTREDEEERAVSAAESEGLDDN